MKKFFTWKPSYKLLAIILTAVLIVALIPLIRLAMYALPWYDDYGYTRYTRSFMAAYGDTFINAMRGVFFQVKESWYAWQGTFSSIFLMALCPIAWGEEYYRYGVMALIIVFTAASFLCVYALSSRMFQIKKANSVCIAIITTLVAVEKMYFPGHGFYWYNGGVHYIGIESFLLFLVAAIVLFMDAKGIIPIVLQVFTTVILALIVSGGNFVSTLQGMLVLIALILYCILKYKVRALRLIPVIPTYAFGMYKNLIAPGNAVRAQYFNGMDPVHAVIKSFPEGMSRMRAFTDVFLFVALLVLIPIVWNGLEKSKCNFRLPLVFLGFMAGLYFATFTPNLYGTGIVDLARVLNICKMTYQFALILGEIYCIGWIKRIATAKKWKLNLDGGYWWVYVLAVLMLVGFFFKHNMERYEYSSYAAFYDVHSGESAALYDEYEDRIKEIESQGEVAYVKPYTRRSCYLRQTDLSEDPTAGENSEMAMYYDKEAIILKSK